MKSVNVLVLSPIGEECLRQIASVSPKIKVQDASELCTFTGRYTAEKQDNISREKLNTMLAQAEVIYGYCPVENVITRAPNLKWIQTMLAAVDYFLNDALVKSPVIVTTSGGVHSTSVAELTLEMMLMLAKQALLCLQMKQKKVWQKFTPALLHSQTVGIIGLGHIGKEVARLAKCFSMRVLALDVKATHFKYADMVLPREQLPKLITESDFVVLTLPFTPETSKLLGEKELRAMKPTAYLINSSRGELIDEKALIRALEENWIAGAGLDAFTTEPLPPESKFWELPNVVMSPHIGGRMINFNSVATALFCENLKRYLKGKELLNVVNKEKGF